MSQMILVNIDSTQMAPVGELKLLDILKNRKFWPEGAVCASQESDGEILYWSAELDTVKLAKELAGEESLMEHVGFKYQVDSWYSDDNHPKLALDWLTCVVSLNDLRPYSSTL